jgi:hypothetical protein
MILSVDKDVNHILLMEVQFVAFLKLSLATYFLKKDLKIYMVSQAPVAHACNPSYSGGRDQENHGLKPA